MQRYVLVVAHVVGHGLAVLVRLAVHLDADARVLVRRRQLVVEGDGAVRVVLLEADEFGRGRVAPLKPLEAARARRALLVGDELHQPAAAADGAFVVRRLEVRVHELVGALGRLGRRVLTRRGADGLTGPRGDAREQRQHGHGENYRGCFRESHSNHLLVTSEGTYARHKLNCPS